MDRSEQSRLGRFFVHFAVEDHARLYKQLDQRLGISRFTQRDQTVALKNIGTGVRHLSDHYSHARDWTAFFDQLADSVEAGTIGGSTNAASANQHRLLQVMIDQPAPSRTSHQRKQCLAIGALAVLAITFKLGRTPSQFADQLKQLFRSDRPAWLELFCVDLLDPTALQAWTPTTSVAVVSEFRAALIDLRQISLPQVAGLLAPRLPEPPPTPDVPTPDVNDCEKSPQTQKPQYRRKQIPDDLTPQFDLFEVQKRRDCQPDIVDGYRLPLHWVRLDPTELQQVMTKLNADLRNKATDITTQQAQAHAAARYVSLFCGMSLKKCLRLPLGRRGSMKLDITHGVIRRDMLLIAPRMDIKDRRRVHGRWWRTRLPAEVRDTLRQLWATHPRARTLGEILKCVGLDHEDCQRLLSEAWPTSHPPEDARFAMSLRPCLLELGVHPALVARVTGDTMTTPASDHYYLSFYEAQVHTATAAFCDWAGLTPPDPPVRDRRIGTPKAMSIQEFKLVMAKLNHAVSAARNRVTTRSTLAQIISFHNLYTVAVALQLIWGVGGRGDRIASMTAERLFTSLDYLAISDRRVDRYSRQRICPSTKALTATRLHYLEHLRSLADSLQHACANSSGYVLKLVGGEAPHRSAFFLLDETPDGWVPRAMRRNDLVAVAKTLGVNELNLARHFWFTELVARGVAQVAIEALLGHHIEGAEAFGFSSGISIREVCDYLRQIMEQVHDVLGVAPLVGRGRQATRYLTFPQLNVHRNLRPLPSVLLKQKLAAQDLLVPEILTFEQDPPTTTKTLLAHSQLDRVKSRYLNRALVRTHPCGALLFCLVTFDLVLTPFEQEALFTAAVGDGRFAVGNAAIVEASYKSRPVAQRFLSRHTLAATHLVKNAPTASNIGYPSACKDLHHLLKKLDDAWPAKDADGSTSLLAMMASHWAAIEIPQGALFSVFHKAPFIPVRDIARLHLQRAQFPIPGEAGPTATRSWKGGGGFDPTLKIVRHWGDKDLPLGEEEVRRVGCRRALALHRKGGDLDEVDLLLLDLLMADLSAKAPYRTLSPTVLPSYAGGYEKYFSRVRQEGSAQLDPEALRDVFAEMGGGSDFGVSGHARWQMLHICAFLATKGYWVPAGFLNTPAQKVPTLPRLPVYTSQSEIGLARQLMDQFFEGQGGTYAFAGVRLQVQREAPMRVCEPRYARPRDWDPVARLFHITSTGHDHLKSRFSRGSVRLTEKVAQELTKFRDRRQGLSVGPDTLLFCDAHTSTAYRAFDQISDAMRDCVIAVTGCPAFRQHDLRAAAATDTAFDVEGKLSRICQGKYIPQTPPTAQSVTHKHARFAWSARMARHASPLTTLRYYICSGLVDLYHHLELAHSNLDCGTAYVAALLGKNSQALYAANHRFTKAGKRTHEVSALTQPQPLHRFIEDILAHLPVPILGTTQDRTGLETTAPIPHNNATRLMLATLLFALGVSEQAAADATLLPIDIVHDACSRIDQRRLALHLHTGKKDELPLLATGFESIPLSIASITHRYADWLSSNKELLQRVALCLVPALDRSGTRLLVQSEAQLLEILHVIKPLHSIGFRTILRVGPGLLLPNLPTVESALRDANVEVHKASSKEAAFCTLAFLLKEEASDAPRPGRPAGVAIESASPRSLGRAGRIVVAGFICGLAL